ncbi:hypothetical protein L6232_23475, partial [Shewanella sp. C31]|nr:hypothetical protein [Shewanella electrica]
VLVVSTSLALWAARALPNPANMDVVAAVSGYISRMVSSGDPSAPGSSSSAKMKIFLLDSETVG